MKHAIITSSDEVFGNHVVQHWLPSLREHMRRDDVDIIVLNYGLSAKDVKLLERQGVTVVRGRKDGHVTNVRHRDAAAFLRTRRYNQVFLSDGGDIVFQSDISALFDTHTADVRAVCQSIYGLSFYYMAGHAMRKERQKHIKRMLRGKKVINNGVLIGPSEKMHRLAAESYALIDDKDIFLADQLAINYILHRDGFREIAETYNFMPLFCHEPITVRNGVVYGNGTVPAIVHNLGGRPVYRPFRRFGYGLGHNVPKYHVIFLTHMRNALFLAFDTVVDRLTPRPAAG